MKVLYDQNELSDIDTLLQTIKRTTEHSKAPLPFHSFVGTPEWTRLLKRHDEKSIKNKMTKVWLGSIIPIEAPKVSQQTLNHAYNFCPSCGFKLN